MQRIIVNTSNALDTLMAKEKCLQWLSECGFSAAGVSELVWKQVPDSGSGDWECPMTECATSMAWYGQQSTTCRTQCSLSCFDGASVESRCATIDCHNWTVNSPHRCGLLRSIFPASIRLRVCLSRGFTRLRSPKPAERIEVLLVVKILGDLQGFWFSPWIRSGLRQITLAACYFLRRNAKSAWPTSSHGRRNRTVNIMTSTWTVIPVIR